MACGKLQWILASCTRSWQHCCILSFFGRSWQLVADPGRFKQILIACSKLQQISAFCTRSSSTLHSVVLWQILSDCGRSWQIQADAGILGLITAAGSGRFWQSCSRSTECSVLPGSGAGCKDLLQFATCIQNLLESVMICHKQLGSAVGQQNAMHCQDRVQDASICCNLPHRPSRSAQICQDLWQSAGICHKTTESAAGCNILQSAAICHRPSMSAEICQGLPGSARIWHNLPGSATRPQNAAC